MRELTGSQVRALGLLRAMDVPGFSAALDEICWERDQLREVAAAARELLPWAENWLPDEAKDQGAREAYVDLREALAKLDGAK